MDWITEIKSIVDQMSDAELIEAQLWCEEIEQHINPR